MSYQHLSTLRFASACQHVSMSAFQQVVSWPRQERRTRLPLVAVPRARLGEAGTEEAELLTSEGLIGLSVLKC